MLATVQSQRIPLPFAGGAYESQSLRISAQEAVNCYPEINERAPHPTALHGDPGASLFASLTDPIRGLFSPGQKMYAVAGSVCYELDASGSATALGNVFDDGKPVSFGRNTSQVLVVSDGRGFVIVNGLAQILDSDFPDTSKAVVQDDYGLLLERGSGRFHFTELGDFQSVSGLDFATAEGAPDDLVSIETDHREIWLFGEETTEVWVNTGSANNPFQRQAGGFIERGCIATHSVAKLDNTVFWLGEDLTVYKAEALSPLRVSNHGIENLISQVASPQNAVAYAYTWMGHPLYQLAFPGELTVVYDVSTNEWFTRKSLLRADHPCHFHTVFNRKHYVGSVDGKIYQLDGSLYEFGGEPMPRTRAVGPFEFQGRFFTVPRLEILLETGETALSDDAEVFIQLSADGGKTFGDRFQGIVGAQGHYTTPVTFFALGGFYSLVIRLTMTDAAKFAVVDAYMDVA